MDFSRPKCRKELQGGASPSYQWLYNAMSKLDISTDLVMLLITWL
jgi:hypothetical protein